MANKSVISKDVKAVRLIDADKLLALIHKRISENQDIDIERMVEDMPTAFDLEDVIYQVESIDDGSTLGFDSFDNGYDFGQQNAVMLAIDIIKSEVNKNVD